MFNWQDFMTGKTYVEVTRKNVKDFLSECDKRGLKWITGYDALGFVPKFSDKIYISYNFKKKDFGLGCARHIETLNESGLKLVKWSDYAGKNKEQEENPQLFNWQKFTNKEIYVEVTHENVENFLKECDKRGLKWRSGHNVLDFIPEFSGKAYISHNLLYPIINGIGYTEHIELVEQSGLPLVKWSDYAKENKKQEENPQQFNWISCTDRLPEKSGNYLTVSTSGRYEVLPYSVRHKAWNTFDDLKTCCSLTNIVAWAKIPPYVWRSK